MTRSAEESGNRSLSAALHESRLSVVASDAFAFLVGAVAFVEVQVVGRLYVGELILFVCGFGLPLLYRRLSTRRERRLLAWFFLLAAMYLLALVTADLYRGTAFTDYARGWARALVFLGGLAGLITLGYRRPTRLVLFVAGTVVSQLALTGFGFWPADWKFGYAYPATAAVLVLVSSRKHVLSFAVLTCLALAHLLMDFRIFGAICIVAAILTYVKGSPSGIRRRFVALVAATGAVAAFAFVYFVGATLGGDADDLIARRQGSNIERLAGFMVGAEAIRESPLIGHGSWAKSDEALDTWAMMQEQLGSPRSAESIQQQVLLSPDGATIRAHSMILQAWVEAGLVGLVFFGFAFGAAGRMLIQLVSAPVLGRHYALVCFFGLWLLWALVMSPFAGVSRLYTATSFSLLFVFTGGTDSR